MAPFQSKSRRLASGRSRHPPPHPQIRFTPTSPPPSPDPSLRPPPFRVFRVFRGPLFRFPSPPFASLRAIRGQLLRPPPSAHRVFRGKKLRPLPFPRFPPLVPNSVYSVCSVGHSSESPLRHSRPFAQFAGNVSGPRPPPFVCFVCFVVKNVPNSVSSVSSVSSV
jgi:hypothetical protein